MSHIPDPRRYGSSEEKDAPGALMLAHARGDGEARASLRLWVTERLEAGRDEEIFDALRHAPSHGAYCGLWDLVCRAVDGLEDDGHALRARLFALPIVLVAASSNPAVIGGTLPDVAAIRALLERHGAVGATRNFGLSNALCSVATLERLRPSVVYRWSREWAGAPRDITPEDIHVRGRREQVHLRLLAGAGITPREAPSFLETASNIGAWGHALTRVLVRQLARSPVELLAIPRAPVSLLHAPHAGRSAELESAFNLFASNTLRQFRSSVGDPEVIVSAHRGERTGEVRVSMSSALDDTALEGFRWPLHPLDDLERVAELVTDLMHDCRVENVRFIDRVLPERLASGRLFLRPDDALAIEAPH